MTREKRLELLKQIEKDIYVCGIESTLLDDAKSCAIHSVIEELEQEPCDDCISREAVIKTIAEWFFSKEFHYINAGEYLRKRIDELQSVTPQPKMGRWILQGNPYSKLYGWYKCSGCGAYIGEIANYCSECGSYNGGDDNADSD